MKRRAKKRRTLRFYGHNRCRFNAQTWIQAQQEIEKYLNFLIDQEFPLVFGLRRFEFVVKHWVSPSSWVGCRNPFVCPNSHHEITVKVRVFVLLAKLGTQTSCEFTVRYGATKEGNKKAGK